MPLTLTAVSHHYGRETAPVLREVTLEFPDGASIAIVGPSGSGKSTLLAIAGLLLEPSSGAVSIDGLPVRSSRRPPATLRAELFAWVFQTVNVLGGRSALDNAMLGLLARGCSRSSARRDAAAALEAVGLGALATRTARSLSGGELQRVCIARAIAVRPRFLLADEPTGQLDAATTSQVVDALIESRPAGTTLIVVTHDEAVAARCERRIRLGGGGATWETPP
jgi:ABC-type lipoprotein export system ATPase subunit